MSTDRQLDLDSLRIACYIATAAQVSDYRRARDKKGDSEAIDVIDDVIRLRGLIINPGVNELLIRRMMRY